MSKQDLKTQADELEALLAADRRSDSDGPPINESYMIAADPIQHVDDVVDTEQVDEDRYKCLPDLVRAIVEYAVNKAPSDATARDIGQAIGVGAYEAAHQLKLKDERVVEAVDHFLAELDAAVREKLSME